MLEVRIQRIQRKANMHDKKENGVRSCKEKENGVRSCKATSKVIILFDHGGVVVGK